MPEATSEATLGKLSGNQRATSAPLVTLAIIAYNQEAFVGEAIAGALAQDYPNLEIVLSDDCSPDATFARMQEAAAAYAGPHRIVLNRSASNRGLLRHIYEAVAKSSGAFLVLGAGDDVSLPHRVSALVAAWQATGASALSSDWDVIDDAGVVTGSGAAEPAAMVQPWYVGDAPVMTISGASGAYERGVFEALALPDFPVFAEDFFFALLLNLRSRRIVHVRQKLVQYRVHDASMTHHVAGPGALAAFERKNARYAAQVCDLLDYVEQVAVTGAGIAPGYGTPRALNLKRFRADLRHLRFRARWIDAPPLRRIGELLRVRSREQLVWLAPRSLGLGTLAALQRMRAGLRR